jgi:hypothetical protein
MGTRRRCHCEAQSAEAIPTDGFRLLRFARNDEKESPSTDQELGLESGGRVGMKICLICSHGGHLTEMSGSRGRLDPDSGSGTTQSTSKYSMVKQNERENP